ncbi:2-amino-4-hydroxy-6-hydroxymethyldihydropteridine diphosphokinase [Solemya velesiana gill symbiont]|uniref:2-amino-4-hydroxy-6-hydroxymethyldihydropteridine pyrophosphokinase n=1 Tax=Solemya velesiana gill symbiont TaxID=1918948 RepID=A0A1T2KNY9_9GAMM|nr:2-amino-4-hydroxy-6-hydroxymethyldihydropteridine diphosphokinase [Solemya velesiana gill symbiont]OOZ34400.1 2-amino-4-hydroxy-6-hydroxymethyldihydropteridine diphosphokinase [Solemya velesiana gill symbiont]
MPESVLSFIGLGSNLDEPAEQVRSALVQLQALPRCRLVSHSNLYQSKPMGPADQPDYINAVAALETSLESFELLAELQAIETEHGRVRKECWGARTLDLDVLIYDELVIDTPQLTIPHPGLPQRAFVLYPLQELVAADFIVPGMGKLRDLLDECPFEGLSIYD